MTFRSKCIGAAAACFVATALAHPDKVEDRLLFHFATGVHPIENGAWPDLTHRLKARVQGAPVLTNVGPAQALVFNGYTDWLLAAGSRETAEPVLPKKEFSVSAWVNLTDTQDDGGIAGFIQDNGNYEKGWLLGYTRTSFSFVLSSQGADDGDGKLTKLTGRLPIKPGRWHYVVATYDGATMRLFVDGQLDGTSTAQSGDVLYPERGRLALGAYADDNELYPMEGGLFEVKTYARVLGADEIAEVARKNAPFLAWEASINRVLQFVVQPYLQFGTRDSMTIMCETTGPAIMTVEYGELQPLQLRASTTSPKHLHELTLKQLKGFTRYFYRVSCADEAGNLARSELFSFQTAPDGRQAWAFGILGDTQRNPLVTQRCAEGIFALRPNFVLHCGDLVDDGFAKQQWVFDLFQPSARLIAHAPMFPVLGNHERNSPWFYDYFSLPAPEYFYTFAYGNAQFFMIDSNKDCRPGSEQYKWLEGQLAQSKAVWKFACHHHPCFSSDENDYGDHLKGKPVQPVTWGDPKVKPLVPLYEKYGLDIAWAGHVHSYERTWPILQMAINQQKGVRYVVSGGGGGGLEQAAPQRSWFSLHLQRGHHFAFVAVHDRTLQLKAYDIEGRLFDTFELTKPKGR